MFREFRFRDGVGHCVRVIILLTPILKYLYIPITSEEILNFFDLLANWHDLESSRLISISPQQ